MLAYLVVKNKFVSSLWPKIARRPNEAYIKTIAMKPIQTFFSKMTPCLQRRSSLDDSYE